MACVLEDSGEPDRACTAAHVHRLGPNSIALYNVGYIPILGDKHPNALGHSMADVWSEIWDELRPLNEIVMRGELALVVRDVVDANATGVVERSAQSDRVGNVAGASFKLVGDALRNRICAGPLAKAMD